MKVFLIELWQKLKTRKCSRNKHKWELTRFIKPNINYMDFSFYVLTCKKCKVKGYFKEITEDGEDMQYYIIKKTHEMIIKNMEEAIK